MKKLLGWSVLILVVVAAIYMLDVLTGLLYPRLVSEQVRVHLDLLIECSNGNCQSEMLRQTVNPYLLFDNTPNYSRNNIPQHNSSGFRNTREFDRQPPDSVFRILCLGGSTTYGHGVKDPNDAWPTILQELLNKRLLGDGIATKTIEVLNGGVNSAASFDLLNHYQYKGRLFHPEMVLIHSGGNDARPLLLSNFKEDYSHWRSIDCGMDDRLSQRELDLLTRSNIVKLVYARTTEVQPTVSDRAVVNTKEPKNLSADEIASNIERNTSEAYERNLAMLFERIAKDAALPVHFQFVFPGERLLHVNSEEVREVANSRLNYDEFIELFLVASQKTSLASKRVCDSLGVANLVMDNDVIPIDCFVDQCHLNAEGQMQKAAFLEKQLAPVIMKLLRE